LLGSRLFRSGSWDQAPFILGLGRVVTGLGSPFIRHSNRIRRVGRTAKSIATATRAIDRDLLEGQGKGAHELGSSAGPDHIVVPVRLVQDGDLEGELVKTADAANANVEVGLEVSGVVVRAHKLLHLKTEQLNVLEGGVVRNINLNALVHGLAAADVVDPVVVELNVGNLGNLLGIAPGEDGVQQGDALDNQLDVVNVDTVADIIGMLDEKEDAGTKELLAGDGEDEGQREQRGTSRGNNLDSAASEEGDCCLISSHHTRISGGKATYGR
jgi:hypothetical protein